MLRTLNPGRNLHFQHLKKAVKTQKSNNFGAKFERLFSGFLTEVCFCFSHKIEKNTNMLEMKISTSFWGEQHPNSGQNIQQRS